jgi:hypothetical protein
MRAELLGKRSLPRLLAGALTAMLAYSLLLLASSVPSAHAEVQSPVCSWAGETDQRDVNIGAPDDDEWDWLSPLAPSSSTEVVISGEYPAARYFSFHVYNDEGEALGSIYDSEIEPDAGSANPYQAKPRKGTGRSYHVTIRFEPKPADPAPNTFYTGEPSSSPAALLVYRVYVPTDTSDPTGGAPYPQVTLASAEGTPIVEDASCSVTPPSFGSTLWQTFAESSLPDGLLDYTPANATDPPQWSRAFGSRLGNEQNAYLTADISSADGQLVVFHAKAPTFPNTVDGVPVYRNKQLRYWSFCTYDPEGEVLVGCEPDYLSAIRGGDYTFVVSSPADKPANATAANGVTWLPLGAQPAAQIVMRNMLPAATFPYAAESITSPTQSAQQVMGRYYPTAIYCATATFEAGGWKACERAAKKGLSPTG